MRHPSHLPPHEARIQVAWQAPLATAVKTPGLVSALVCRHELLPRVAAYYIQLQALPRRVRRALHRQLGLPLATLALWLALGQLPVLAATIAVGGPCTLVDAIVAANTDTATGGCAAGSGADTIVLPADSTQTLSRVHNDTYGPTGLPVVSSVITIAGHESTIARASEAPEFRLFAVNSTGELTLQETTVRGGVASGRFPSGNGGAVFNNSGTLTVTNSTLTGNISSSRGGGVGNSGGTLTVTHSTTTGTTATYGGGGVDSYRGTLTVTNSTITGTTAEDGRGGGVFNAGGTLTLTTSIITGNGGNGVRRLCTKSPFCG